MNNSLHESWDTVERALGALLPSVPPGLKAPAVAGDSLRRELVADNVRLLKTKAEVRSHYNAQSAELRNCMLAAEQGQALRDAQTARVLADSTSASVDHTLQRFQNPPQNGQHEGQRPLADLQVAGLGSLGPLSLSPPDIAVALAQNPAALTAPPLTYLQESLQSEAHERLRLAALVEAETARLASLNSLAERWDAQLAQLGSFVSSAQAFASDLDAMMEKVKTDPMSSDAKSLSST